MKYIRTKLKEEIIINSIVTVHYFEFTKNYAYKGEYHNFWELVYVDKGRIEVTAKDENYKLKSGEMIFHKPNEFHNLKANGKIAPNLVVLSFHTNSPSMSFFENRIVKIDNFEKTLLAKIIKEAQNAFSSDLNKSTLTKLEPRLSQPFGSEQLIKIYLGELLISLVRSGKGYNGKVVQTSIIKEHFNENQTNSIINFMEDNISNNLTFKDISEHFNISTTNLKVNFKNCTGYGVMSYYNYLKTESAKRMIREDDLNFTQIGEKLGYSSVHYFSRHFKKSTGMTPSEYAHSVKSTMDP